MTGARDLALGALVGMVLGLGLALGTNASGAVLAFAGLVVGAVVVAVARASRR